MRIISETGAKTYQTGAGKIADTPGAGMIPACYVAPAEIRDARELMRCRIRRVQDRTAVINQLRSLLDKYDVKIDASNMHSKKAVRLPGKTRLGMPNDDLILASCTERIAHVTDRTNQAGGR